MYKESIIKNLKEGGEEYKTFFKGAMKKFNVTTIAGMTDEKKKEFFDYVEKNFKAKNESIKEMIRATIKEVLKEESSNKGLPELNILISMCKEYIKKHGK